MAQTLRTRRTSKIKTIEANPAQGQLPSRRMAACLVHFIEFGAEQASSSGIVLAFLKRKDHPIFATLRGGITNYLSYRGIKRYGADGRLVQPRSGRKKFFWDIEEFISEYYEDKDQIYTRLKYRALQYYELEDILGKRLERAPSTQENPENAKFWAKELSSMSCAQWDFFINKEGRHWKAISKMGSEMIQSILRWLGSPVGDKHITKELINFQIGEVPCTGQREDLLNPLALSTKSERPTTQAKLYASQGFTLPPSAHVDINGFEANDNSMQKEGPLNNSSLRQAKGLKSSNQKQVADTIDHNFLEHCTGVKVVADQTAETRETGPTPEESGYHSSFFKIPSFPFSGRMVWPALFTAALFCIGILITSKELSEFWEVRKRLPDNKAVFHNAPNLPDFELNEAKLEHDGSARELTNYGVELIRKGEAGAALEVLGRAQALGDNNLKVDAKIVFYQAKALVKLGKLKNAAELFNHAYTLFQKIPGTNKSQMLTKTEEAYVHYLLNEPEEASEALDSALNEQVSDPKIRYPWLVVKTRLDTIKGDFPAVLKSAMEILEIQSEGELKSEAMAMMSFASVLNDNLSDAFYYKRQADALRGAKPELEMYATIADILVSKKLDKDPSVFVSKIKAYLATTPDRDVEILLGFAVNFKNGFY